MRILPDGNIEETSPESPDGDILDELIEIIDCHTSQTEPNSLSNMQNSSPLPPLFYAMPIQPVEPFNSSLIPQQLPFFYGFEQAPTQEVVYNQDLPNFVEQDAFQQRLFDDTVPQPQRSTLACHVSDVTGSGLVHSESLLRDESTTLTGVQTEVVTEKQPEPYFGDTEHHSTAFQPY